jgi:TonB family protein
MNRRDHTLAIALCVSLVAHTGTLLVLAGQYASAPRNLPALATASRPEAGPIFVPQPPPPAELLFGDQKGTGDAMNSAPGDESMVGRDGGQVQAFLSRDPVGAGKVGVDPTMNVLPPGVQISSPPSPPPSPPSTLAPPSPQPPSPPRTAPPPVPPAPAPMIGFADSGVVPAPPRVHLTPPAPIAAARPKDPPPPKDLPPEKEPAPAKDAPPTPPAPAPPVSPASDVVASAAPMNTAPGSSAPAADPAIMSDSESDPFAKGHSIEFRDGAVQVRFGRKVKTVRPKLSLVAQYDLLAMQFPHMTVRVHVDDAGAVRKVEIVKSSGSESADQAVKIAMYQWWFEPPKNKGGAAMPDIVEFPIAWR